MNITTVPMMQRLTVYHLKRKERVFAIIFHFHKNKCFSFQTTTKTFNKWDITVLFPWIIYQRHTEILFALWAFHTAKGKGLVKNLNGGSGFLTLHILTSCLSQIRCLGRTVIVFEALFSQSLLGTVPVQQRTVEQHHTDAWAQPRVPLLQSQSTDLTDCFP